MPVAMSSMIVTRSASLLWIGAVLAASAAPPGATTPHGDEDDELVLVPSEVDDTRKPLISRHGGSTGKRGGAREVHLDALEQDNHSDTRQPWSERIHLTGGWAGVRGRLEGLGFEFAPGAVIEGQAVARRGGARWSSSQAAEAMLVWHGDAAGWRGFKIVALPQAFGGDAIASHLGDLQGASNLAAPSRVQLSELWFQQEVLKGRLSLKAGRFDANVDLAACEWSTELLMSSFGLPPAVALPTYPNPGLGVVIDLRLHDAIRVEAALTETSPDVARWAPTRWSPGSGTALAEATIYTHPLGSDGVGGSIHLGGWMAGPSAPDGERAAGAWFMTEEPIWAREATVMAFFHASLRSPATDALSASVAGGLVAQGAISARPHDVSSIAVGSARAADGWESTLEVMYKIAFAASLSAAFDAQYVHQPAGRPGAGAMVFLHRWTVQL